MGHPRSTPLLYLDKVLNVLRSIDWSRLGVSWVLLFGSLAARGWGRDIDLLAHPTGEGGSTWRLELATRIAELVGVDWSHVDVTEASTDTPCPIVVDAWTRGKLIYEERRGAHREWLLVRVAVCNDYMIAARKLKVVETALKAVERRWGSGGPS
jgi:predicted nucleotidyltransferase